MKKQIILFLFVFLLKLFLPLKPYLECNHLTIITKIDVQCGSSYDITYYETIPMRENNGIQYHTKKYHVVSQNLIEGIHRIEKGHSIYKEKATIVSNCDDSIIQTLKET